MKSKLWKMSQAAEQLQTSERHLRRLVAERKIPFTRVGKFIRFDPRDLERWLESHRVDAVQ